MKIFVLILFFFLSLNSFTIAQNKVFQVGMDTSIVQSYIQKDQCLSDQARLTFLESNLSFIKERKLSNKYSNSVKDASKLKWPLKAADSLKDYSYYAIINFVDHDSTYPNKLLDYYGGTRTYDRENGYNHAGMDVIPWPFPWYKMENNLVEVISMADGIIVDKYDGNYDKNCEMNSLMWNVVSVLHDNGLLTWYGHLKNGSVTAKQAGDTIKSGEYIGLIGSSGSSVSPHLHLELHDSEGNIIDPWEGPYNPSITSSLWENQKPYYDSRINKLSTHSGIPVYPDCPETEYVKFKNNFQAGDTVYLCVHYMDVLKDQVTNYEILKPDKSVWLNWQHKWELDNYSAAYWCYYIILPEDAEEGYWEYSVKYVDSLYAHKFYVENTSTKVLANNTLLENFIVSQNYPNPFNPVTNIEYEIKTACRVKVSVYDFLGREVTILTNSFKNPGKYNLRFDGTNLASGFYFCRFELISSINSKIQTKNIKMNLIK